jgi:uncharacterized protein YegP (UPF0339 family)
VADGGVMAGKFVLKKDKAGQFRFNLVASNGEIIATSESYTSKSAALNGVDSVRRNAGEAELVDETAGNS